MVLVYEECTRAGEWLAIWDCRMFDAGYVVIDVRLVFPGPAFVARDFATVDDAAAFVLARQGHCNAIVSSWPDRPDGQNDFRWMLQRLTPPTARMLDARTQPQTP